MVSLVTPYDIAALRQEEFPFTADTVYLNHASISPMPQRSSKVAQRIVEQMSGNATQFFQQVGIPMFEQFDSIVQHYLNAELPQEIVHTTSTSAGINAVANAIQWRDGDEIIFCDVEFPSNVYPWMAQERRGVKCVIVPAQKGTLTREAIEAAITDRTRLVAVSALQFFTGGRADLAAIGAFCRERDILFAVDAIQAIGHMPIDVQAMNIDILSAGAQKSMMAMMGAGILYVRDAVAEQLLPASVGPNATEDWILWLDYNIKPLPGAHRFVAGTANTPGMFSVLESLAMFEELGRHNIDEHTTKLADYAIEQLLERGFEVLTDPEQHGPIVTFKYADTLAENDEFLQKLAEKQIVTMRHLNAHGDPYVRLSFHCYNNEDDIDTFLHSF